MLVTGCRVTRLYLVEGDLARLEGRPEETLVPPSSKGRHGQSSNQLHAVLLALVKLGLGSPGKEDRHILGHLRHGSLSAVLVLDGTIHERLRHLDLEAREVGVEMLALCHHYTRRGFTVAGEEREDVVGATVASLDDERQVGRQTAVVGVACLVLVHVGALDVIRELARSLEHGASVVRAIRVLLVGSHLFGLVLSVAHTDEVTVRDTLQSVASSTHLSIHLVATADRGSIVGMHHAVVRPGVLDGVHDIAIGASGLGGSNEGSTTCGGSCGKLTQNPGR
mmetsp:Transcript_2844/g.4546  ORF Transcript_2844/g.4546 Transcript_2844/m.4546 type:complete len:280 (-) Transcript_2844:232-1071(-)